MGALSVWMQTTPKGKEKKALIEEKIKDVWGKIQKEYAAGHPDGIKNIKKDVSAALKSWDKSAGHAEVKKALNSLAKKLK